MNGGNGYGIDTNDSTLTIDSCVFQNNDIGFYGSDDGGNISNTSILNSTFDTHNNYFLYTRASLGNPSVFNLINCVFANTGRLYINFYNTFLINRCDFSGVAPIVNSHYLALGQTNGTIKNSIFHDITNSGNTWVLIWNTNPSQLNIDNCTFDSISLNNLASLITLVDNPSLINVRNCSFTNNPNQIIINTSLATDPGNITFENHLVLRRLRYRKHH